MAEYKPNSHRYKAEQKDVPAEKRAKVVTSNVKQRKKSEVRKLADNFISEDLANIKTYVVSEVIIPTLKNTIWDAFTNSLDMILFKGDGRGKKRSGGSHIPYVSYDRFSSGRERRYEEPRSRSSRFDIDEIIFETRGDAEAVLIQLEEILDAYKIVTVADLYDTVDLSAPYTSNKYGWTNLRNAEPVRVRDGYILKMPKAIPID